MAKVDYGAVALIPVGAYDASRQYHANELVGYQGSSYVALQNPPVGTLPTNTTYFMLHTEGTSIATASTPGTVKPDGTSTVVDANGAMSVKPSLVQAIQDTAESASESASKIGNVPTGKTLQAQIDGLEPRVSSSEQALTVNLLNPRTSSSGEINGLTFRYNGDGTYTVNGEATKDTYFNVNLNPFQLEKTGKFKALGCPLGGSSQSYYAIVTLENGSIIARDFGNGTAAMLEANTNYIVKIGAKNGTVCDNLVFKPMLTTNLSATYDDYVPYSGSSGKLDTDFKTLSEKIGNVGNTDLQSQLNAATQSIAQNTTDIAANAAGISALNTGLTSKIASYTDIVSHKIGTALYNTESRSILHHDDEDNIWRGAYDVKSVDRTGLNVTDVSPKMNLREINAMQFGSVAVLSITFDVNQSITDGEILLNIGNLRPLLYVFSTTMNGSRAYNHLALNADGTLRALGNLVTGTFFSASFTYVI